MKRSSVQNWQVNLTIDFSFIATTGDPNRVNIDPDELGTLEISSADEAAIDNMFDFFARYVRKVQSDELIRRKLKAHLRLTFIDIIGPNDIAYVIAAFKNNMDCGIRTCESWGVMQWEIRRKR